MLRRLPKPKRGKQLNPYLRNDAARGLSAPFRPHRSRKPFLMSIVLYNAAYSTCSQKVRLCLAEKGLPFEEKRLNLAKREHLSADYLAMNPNGVVPTLVDDGKAIIDSSVICEFLDEVYGGPALTPSDAVERAKMRAWMRFVEEVPTAAVRVPSFNRAFLGRFDGQDRETFLKQEADIRPLRKHFYRRMGPGGFAKADVEASLEQLRKTAGRIASMLQESGGPWLLGDAFSLADIVVLPLMDRADDLGLSDQVWADMPDVQQWLDACRSRPSYSAAFYPGARLSDTHQFRVLFQAEAEGEGTAS